MNSPFQRTEFDRLQKLTLQQYIREKLIMLKDDFKFRLTRDEIFAIEHAKSEDELDRMVHDLFKKYL